MSSVESSSPVQKGGHIAVLNLQRLELRHDERSAIYFSMNTSSRTEVCFVPLALVDSELLCERLLIFTAHHTNASAAATCFKHNRISDFRRRAQDSFLKGGYQRHVRCPELRELQLFPSLFVATILSPIASIVLGEGPMKYQASFNYFSGKLPHSRIRNPYPGWIASTFSAFGYPYNEHAAVQVGFLYRRFSNSERCIRLLT